MKNKFFTYRFLPILSVFLFALFVFFTNVKATSDTYKTVVTPKGDTYILPVDCTDNFFICNVYNNLTYLISGNSSNWIFSESNGDVVVNNNSGAFTVYSISQGNFDFRNYTNKFSTTWTNINPEKNVSYAGCNILYSTSDLYNASGDIFFQKTLLGITETLVAETNKAQITEQLKTMIAGFLKYLIVLVISVIAFWKGWQFLSTQLKKA